MFVCNSGLLGHQKKTRDRTCGITAIAWRQSAQHGARHFSHSGHDPCSRRDQGGKARLRVYTQRCRRHMAPRPSRDAEKAPSQLYGGWSTPEPPRRALGTETACQVYRTVDMYRLNRDPSIAPRASHSAARQLAYLKKARFGAIWRPRLVAKGLIIVGLGPCTRSTKCGPRLNFNSVQSTLRGACRLWSLPVVDTKVNQSLIPARA